MNPVAALFIVLGVLFIIMAIKGSYNDMFKSLRQL